MPGPEAGPRPSEIVRRSARYLERHGVPSPRETAEALLMHILGTDRASLYSRSDGLDTRTARLFGQALCQRCGGVPLQHLTGEQPFRSLRLQTRPGVFVPRPETEVLVDHALATISETADPVVVDVGTGTGAIALSVKLERPDARVLATDLTEDAVVLASANARRHGLELEIVLGDLLAPLPEGVRGEVDLVVSNPPYVRREEYESLPSEVKADPYEALVGGTDVHARLAQGGPAWLRAGGWLVVEIGDDQANEVRSLFDAAGFVEIDVLPDLAGRDRVVRGRRATTPVERERTRP